MRILSTLSIVVLAAGAFLAAGSTQARADAAAGAGPAPAAVAALDPIPAQPGTDAEAREYELREARSPETRDFVGGHASLFGLLVFVALVLFIVWLAKEI